jgi:hypothetical protein
MKLTEMEKFVSIIILVIALTVVAFVLISGCTQVDDSENENVGVIERSDHVIVIWEDNVYSDEYIMFAVPEMNITCISYDGGDDGGIHCQPGIKTDIVNPYGY